MLEVGRRIPPCEFPAITQEQLRAYAEASGDPNPIHLDEAVARKAGLPGVIAHGMLTAAFIGECAQAFARAEGYRITRLQTRFKTMTMLGDVVTVDGSVVAVEDGVARLELQARSQKGEVTTTGMVEVAHA